MERDKRETILLQSDKRLGLIPSQIIYVEGYYDKSFNKFIKRNIGSLQEAFARKGYDFIYFPNIIPQINNRYKFIELLKLVDYFFPSSSINRIANQIRMDDNNMFSKFRIESSSKAKQLFSNFDYDRQIKPGFLRLIDNSEKKDRLTFEYYPIELYSSLRILFCKQKYWIEINNYVENLAPVRVDNDYTEPPIVRREKGTILGDLRKKDNVYGSIISEQIKEEREFKVVEKIDFDSLNKYTRPAKKTKLDHRSRLELPQKPDIFSREYDIIDKIKAYIHEARQLGIYEEVIKEALETLAQDSNIILDNGLKISRLVIDSDYRIFLPDYGSMEIKMTTLPKSLFILFLWHPEGIILKQLSDYEPELMRIYQIISKRENLSDMNDSIKRICTPLDSSANEKLSRIREAFVRNISDKHAEYYYVTGDRGEKKQIILDRELLSLPKELKH